jgi:hypothetical protein
MAAVTIIAISDQSEPVAFATRVRHRLGSRNIRPEPWIEVTGVILTSRGAQLYETPMGMVMHRFDMYCDDGLNFLDCVAPSASFDGVRFFAMDVLDGSGKCLVV